MGSTIVIVGDGVAYEMACQVAEKVKNGSKLTTTTLLADIPSETENNMSRIYMANGVTEKVQSNREKYLQQQNTDKAIDFIKLDDVNDEGSRAQYLICTYKDIDDLKNCFVEFANKVPFYGFVILCLDEPALQDIIPLINKKIFTYGLTPQADVRAFDIVHKEFESTFSIQYKGSFLGTITINIPGVHNIKNALVAVTVGIELGVPFEIVKKALEAFSGVYRRFEIKLNKDILLIDDYAHHPTETSATLSGIRSGWKRRLISVFQPHLFSRTRDFYEEFGRSFLLSDIFICTDVYPARELPIEGITGEMIVKAARKFGHKNAVFIQNKEDVPAYLSKIAQKDDIIVTMGAGDIWKYGEKFRESYLSESGNGKQ